MSQARVQKLQTLLARVQQRRNEPRLVPVGVSAQASANTNLSSPALELAKPIPEQPTLPPIEEVIAPTAPSSIPPPASSIPPPPALPPLPAMRTSLPPSKPSTSTVPPASHEHLGRATTEVLPAAEPAPATPLRVAPSPVLPFDSAVRVTSSPRIDAPRSFGELLEQSLALRPKSG
jgi:hypothetical protein